MIDLASSESAQSVLDVAGGGGLLLSVVLRGSIAALFSSIRGTGGIAMLFLSRFPEKRPLILSSTYLLLERDLGV